MTTKRGQRRAIPEVEPRRTLLCRGAGTLAALVLPGLAAAQRGPGQVRDLDGEAWINDTRADWGSSVRPGDRVRTGSGSRIVFVIGADAFLLRGATELRVEGRGAANVFRLLTGALAASFGRSTGRRVITPTVTAGIRGTALYAEVLQSATYLCTCHGTVELSAGDKDRERVQAQRHSARLVAAGRSPAIATAPLERHTDAEIETLEEVAGRRAPWRQ